MFVSCGWARALAWGSQTAQPDDRFCLSGIGAGTYRLEVDVNVGTGFWLRAAIADGRDWLDQPITFGAGSTSVSDVRIVPSRRHTSLTGHLRNASGE